MIEVQPELFRAAITVLIGSVAWAVARLIRKVDRLDEAIGEIRENLATLGALKSKRGIDS